MLVERAKNINMNKKSDRDRGGQGAGGKGIKSASSGYIGGGRSAGGGA